MKLTIDFSNGKTEVIEAIEFRCQNTKPTSSTPDRLVIKTETGGHYIDLNEVDYFEVTA